MEPPRLIHFLCLPALGHARMPHVVLLAAIPAPLHIHVTADDRRSGPGEGLGLTQREGAAGCSELLEWFVRLLQLEYSRWQESRAGPWRKLVPAGRRKVVRAPGVAAAHAPWASHREALQRDPVI